MDSQLVDLQTTLKLITEEQKKPSVADLATSDASSNAVHKILRPKGIVIQDTFNNPLFPIPYPLIDSTKFNLPEIRRQYTLLYSKFDPTFLPWHYTVEIINGDYYFFQTRPLDSRFPFTTQKAYEMIESNDRDLSDETIRYFKIRPFPLEDSIHICLIGNSNKDVYLEELYYTLGKGIIYPMIAYFKINKNLNILNFNMGKKFKFNKVFTYIVK